jgi:TolB-like protein
VKKTVFLAGLFAVVTAAVFAQNAELPRLAVVEFSTNLNNEKVKADAITVRNLVESQMVGTRKYQIITRDDIDKLLANQRIQVSSISSTENLKKLQLQNISYIVTGSVDAMGNDYAITVRVLDVSTGQFSHSANDFMGSGSRDMYNGINGLMSKFVAGMSSEGDRVTQTASSKTYNVGDFGPAGGFIFYDKGVFSNGWRYLEAAPAETEFTAQWGAYERDVTGTNTGVGFGKRNTELIVERLRTLGENGKAAQLCVSLDFDGYKDWFLPSKDELDLMYKNLKQKGLGGFKTVQDSTNYTHWYWSSSQTRTGNTWFQRFSDGGQESGNKSYTNSVRAVRAF